MIPAFSKCMIPNTFSVNAYTMNSNWISYAQQLCAKLLLKLSIITLWSKQWLHALEITMIIKGQKVQALLDMESQVTLMNESYYMQNIQHLLPTVDKDHLNAHKLFNLKGVEDGCVPLTKYFSVDIQVGGRLIHDTGILVKKDNIPLTDSKGRSTQAPAILGCSLI